MTKEQKHHIASLRSAALAAIDALNAAVAPFSDRELEVEGLDMRFFLGMAGLPHDRTSAGNLICTKHEQIPTFPAAPLDAELERRRLRQSGLPESVIWSRFPAKTFDERAEQLERTHARKQASPLEAFVLAQAKHESKLRGKPAEAIAADPAFQASAAELFNLLSGIGA